MNLSNINPTTGIRFGAISGQSIHPEVLDELHSLASNEVYHRLRDEREQQLRAELRSTFDRIDDDLVEQVIEMQLEAESEHGDFNDEEPSADIVHEGVSLNFGYLGGAVLLIIYDSPYTWVVESLCSPCVPNAANLDSAIDPDGYIAYAPANSWLATEEN